MFKVIVPGPVRLGGEKTDTHFRDSVRYSFLGLAKFADDAAVQAARRIKAKLCGDDVVEGRVVFISEPDQVLLFAWAKDCPVNQIVKADLLDHISAITSARMASAEEISAYVEEQSAPKPKEAAPAS